MKKYSSLLFFLCGSLSTGLFWLLSSQMEAHSSWSLQGGPGVRTNSYLRSNLSKPEEQAVSAALDPAYAAFITLEVIPPYYEPSPRKKEVLVIGPYYDSGQPSVNTAESSEQKKSKRSHKKRIHQVR